MGDETEREYPLTDEDLVEIFAAGSSIEADRVVGLLLEEQIEANRHETSVPAFPGASHRHLITVFNKNRDKAVKLIKDAIKDGILPDDGTFV